MTTAAGPVVLLVDDNDAVRHATARVLTTLGYQVRQADGGEAALLILHSTTQVDLLLTDVTMPCGISGVELVKAAIRIRPSLCVLFASGFAMDETPPTYPIIVKPFRRAALAEAIAAAMNPHIDT